MKRCLLFTLLISFIGYSQNPIQPNHPNFEEGLPQDLVEKMKPINLEFGDDEMMDFNPIQRVNGMKLQSFQSDMMVENVNEVIYRFDGETYIKFDENDLTGKYTRQVDENGNQTHYIQYNWDSESQSFVPSSKSEYTYDENGIQTFYIYYSWDSESQSFVPSRKYENTYDENGNRTHYIRYNWDSESQSFVPILKDETTYDSNFTPVWTRTQWKIEKYYSGLGVYKPSFVKDYSIHSETDTELVIVGIIKQYDTNFNTWNELEGEEFKSYWYYTKTQSLSTNSVEPNSFSIYPNPTSNSLQIHSSESLSNPIFELYDVKGSKILSNPFKLTEPIDVSDLQPSMYIYNVKDGSEVKQSGKIIKE